MEPADLSMHEEYEKLELKKLAKRTMPVSQAGIDEIPSLQMQLQQTGYPSGGNLYKRLDHLYFFIQNRAPQKLKILESRLRIHRAVNFAFFSSVIILVYLILDPVSDLFSRLFGDERLTVVDPMLNLITTSVIFLFATRQILRESGQMIVKELVDELQTLVHLFDMHQLAKGSNIDVETRKIVSEAVIICAKVGAFIYHHSDDPYVVSSIKHLENYSELVAVRISSS